MTTWSDCEEGDTCGLTVTFRGGQQKSTPDRFHDQHDTGRLDILGVQNVWLYLPVGAVELCTVLLCTIQPHTCLYNEIRLCIAFVQPIYAQSFQVLKKSHEMIAVGYCMIFQTCFSLPLF